MALFGFGKKKENEEKITSSAETNNIEQLSEAQNMNDFQPENEFTVEETGLQVETAEAVPTKKSFFQKMVDGLGKTRNNIVGSLENVLKNFTKIDDALFEELEETLILADIGVETSMDIIEQVKDQVKKDKITDVNEIKTLIQNVITAMLTQADDASIFSTPAVLLVIGVNGVGKTTTIGKLSHYYKEKGHKVLLAAADTFRAAAIDQLEIWGQRSGIDVIKHQENSDPGAVVFDAVQAARARKVDVLICDTAGRLHNKKNLMEELKKISRIVESQFDEARKEVYLVLDATTGQNALQQARMFQEVANITGIILTKMDGTAKGGIIIAIQNELKVPVRFIGIGEGLDDLQPFHPGEFANALFSE